MSTAPWGLLRRLGSAGALVVMATVAPGHWTSSTAQTTDPAGVDLTLPPELRGNTPPQSTGPVTSKPSRPNHEKGVRRRSAVRDDAGATVPNPTRPKADAEHPVDLGLTLRGGSATPRVYGATGTAQPIQESGSAFGAGMRFGF